MTKKKKTTMSVPEMQRLLGLGKTDAYWLVKKQCFETAIINGKIRIIIDSFEHWYARQVKHKKVHGPPPGKVLRAESYSPQELAEELGIGFSTIYDIIQRYNIKTFKVDSWLRISKRDFLDWYKTQTRYRTRADRARDAALEAQTMTMPEVAQILGIPRKAVYHILLYGPDRDKFDFFFYRRPSARDQREFRALACRSEQVLHRNRQNKVGFFDAGSICPPAHYI